jgi:hypothetical protein
LEGPLNAHIISLKKLHGCIRSCQQEENEVCLLIHHRVYHKLVCLQVTGTQQQIRRDFKSSSLSILFSLKALVVRGQRAGTPGKTDELGVAGRQVRGAPKPLPAAITAACAFALSLLTPFHQ